MIPNQLRQVQDCCPPDCCRPCCVPSPRAPICTEAYVPAWNDIQCDWGVFFTVDFLYWYAKECNLSYGTKVRMTDTVRIEPGLQKETQVLSPISAWNMDSKWKPGVRAGLGWNTDCDGWDVYVEWTGYWNKNTSSESVEGFENLTPPVGGVAIIPNFLFQNPTIFLFDKAKGEWDLKFNRLDLEFGKRYWLSKCFTMRPYAGIGGIWTETKYEITYSPHTALIESGQPATATFSGKVEIKNKNWGGGLIGGFQPTWQFSDCFALYGDLEMALFWGELKEKNKQEFTDDFVPGGTITGDPLVETIDQNFSNNYHCMLPILDLGIGLRWETYWCDQQYHFALDLGWEHHVLFQHNHRTNFNSPREVIEQTANGGPEKQVQSSIITQEHNLVMGGLVVKVRFDF